MTKKTAFWIFLLGTVSSAVLFLAATWDTHRQVVTLSNVDKLSDQVVAGKRAFEKYNVITSYSIHYTKLYEVGRQAAGGQHRHTGDSRLTERAVQEDMVLHEQVAQALAVGQAQVFML